MVKAKLPLAPPQISRFKLLIRRAGAVLVPLLAVAVIVEGFYIHHIQQQINLAAPDKIQMLIVRAGENLFQTPVVDAPGEKVYLPEARLVLPLQLPAEHQDGIVHFKYYGDQTEITLADMDATRAAAASVIDGTNLQKTFAAVPGYQACNRQVSILFGAGDAGSLINGQASHFEFSKPLTDGRTAYVYRDTGCKQSAVKLLDYLHDVDSY